MKKAGSILFSLLMLAVMFHVSVATHYCHGNLAGSKISLSGELASCGMEGDGENLPLPLTQLESHCCDDVVVVYGINNIYIPSFSAITDSYQDNYKIFSFPLELPVNSVKVFQSLYTSVSPPDELLSTSVDLSDICVFRI